MTRRQVATSACIALIALAAACGPGATEDSEPVSLASDFCGAQSRQELLVDGEERTQRVWFPRDWDGRTRLPVVHVVHGAGVEPEEIVEYTAMERRADALGVVVVAPRSSDRGLLWDYATPSSEPGSDLAYLRELVETVADQDCVDPDRQFMLGLSNGSAMAFALACEAPEGPIAAYATLAGIFTDPGACPEAPRSILYFHGTRDPIVPIEGGPTPIGPAPAAVPTLTGWAVRSGCGSTPTTERVGADVEHLTWPGCDGSVEAYLADGAGHTWPGADPLPQGGSTTTTMDATTVAMEFFGLQR